MVFEVVSEMFHWIKYFISLLLAVVSGLRLLLPDVSFIFDALRDLVSFVQLKKIRKNTHGGVLVLVKLQAA